MHGTIGGRTAVPSDVFLSVAPRTLLSCGSDVETQLRAGQMHDRKPLTFPKALMAKLRQPEAPAPAAPAPPPVAATLPAASLLDIHGAAQELLGQRPVMPAAVGASPGLLLQQAVAAAAAAAAAQPGFAAAPPPAPPAVPWALEQQPGMRRKRAVSGPAPAEPTAKAFRSAQHGVAGADGSITGWAAQQAPADWDQGPDGAGNS